MLPFVILLALALWICVNAYVLYWNYNHFRPVKDYSEGGTLLVIVAHQDDEVILAGGTMLRTISKGGTVHVVYITNGTPPSTPAQNVEGNIRQREEESIACLRSVGVPASNAHFFRVPDTIGLCVPSVLRETRDRLSSLISQLQPYAIITPSFEGGHVDHDLTNYVVMQAVKNTSLAEQQVLEGPEYNYYFMFESIFRRINRFLLVKYIFAPTFIPQNTQAYSLDMNADELQTKRDMFKHFVSSNPRALIDYFAFPDQLRVVPKYDYIRELKSRDSLLRARLRKLQGVPRGKASLGYTDTHSRIEKAIVSYEKETVDDRGTANDR